MVIGTEAFFLLVRFPSSSVVAAAWIPVSGGVRSVSTGDLL